MSMYSKKQKEKQSAADEWNRRVDQYTRAGKWEKSSILGETYNCSICGGAALFYSERGQETKSPYCPHCGVKMEVDE